MGLKKYIYIGLLLLVISAILTIKLQHSKIARLKADNSAYFNTAEALLRDVEHYQIADSINVVKVQAMELTLDDYKRYRLSDLKVIEQLKVHIKGLERIVTTQSSTIYDLSIPMVDSITYNENTGLTDTLKCVTYHDDWLDFVGCFDDNWLFKGRIASRDSLTLVEHVEYKRFLGFLWRTKRIKRREMEVFSKNPHTTIVDAEIVIIRGKGRITK